MLLATAYDLAEPHGLKHMAMKYLNVPNWDITNKEKTKGTADVIVPYLKKDVEYTWEVFCYLMKRVNEQHTKIYQRFLKPAYRTYRDVERTGAYIDIEALKKAII